jgi:hypothetical protein
MNSQTLPQFAERYTAAWCSQNAASMAGFFAPDGSLTINDGTSSKGRVAACPVPLDTPRHQH